MNKDILEILFSKEDIDNICQRLGAKITEDYIDKKPLFIGLLKGCLPFMSDLLKYVDTYANIDYMNVSSYEGTTQGENINIISDITMSLENRDVIIVDDICDSGRTLSFIKSLLEQRGAKSVEICCLLDKPEGRKVNIDVKYIGDVVPNKFVVGYGLDFNELYRNLSYIGVLKPEKYI